MLSTLFEKVWKKLTLFGVSDDFLEENTLTKLLNQLAFTTSAGALAFLIIANLIGAKTIYQALLFVVFSSYALVLVFNALSNIYWTRLYLCSIVPFWLFFSILFIGGNFGQSIASGASIMITYLLFEKHKILRTTLLIFNILIYAIPTIYVQTYGPLYQSINVPLDELLVYVISINWLWVVFVVHDRLKEKLIDRLQKNNAILQQTTEELERFSYIASHDLKSPLRTVVSFLGLIEKDLKKGDYENVFTNLEYAKSGAKQMNYLVSDILELSRINAPDRLHKELVDLDQIIKKVQTNLGDDIKQAKASIDVSPLPSYYCNEVEFLLIFQNIIQNGIKYNKSQQPQLKVWSENGGETLKIHFEDNGIGIEEEYFEQIFQFFKRLHTSDKYSGTGLGLGLCKKILQKYKGDIKVKSIPNKGSIFSIHLPLEQVAHATFQ